MRVRACCLVSVHACVVSERASGRVRVCVMGAPVAVADAHQALAVAAMMCTMTRTCPALVIAFDLQVLIARACARVTVMGVAPVAMFGEADQALPVLTRV